MLKNQLVFIFLTVAAVDFSDAFRVFQVKGVDTILALENEQLNIQCKADTPMAYCGFIHPSGKRYSFSGSSLDAGQCNFSTKATAAENGQWRCHIGRKGAIGLEIMQIINVRVANQLAAIQENITTLHGKEVTLSCATVKGFTPLRYCRFEPPTGKPFSISSEVTPDKPILNRYYFPNNKSLDRGDCAVTIRKAQYEDAGRWTCGAGLDDGAEHLDTIQLEVEGLYTMSTASATGITFGAIGIVAFLSILGFVVWKKRRFLGSAPDEENEHELVIIPAHRSHGLVNEPRSYQVSSHELRSQRGSARELRPLPRSRQGSIHDDPIRRIPLHGSPMMPRLPLAKNVPAVEVQSPSTSAPDEENEHELVILPAHRSHGSVNAPRSHQGSSHELRSQRGSARELRPLPRSRSGSFHDEPIRRIPLHGSPTTPRSPLAKDVPAVEVQCPSTGPSRPESVAADAEQVKDVDAEQVKDVPAVEVQCPSTGPSRPESVAADAEQVKDVDAEQVKDVPAVEVQCPSTGQSRPESVAADAEQVKDVDAQQAKDVPAVEVQCPSTGPSRPESVAADAEQVKDVDAEQAKDVPAVEVQCPSTGPSRPESVAADAEQVKE